MLATRSHSFLRAHRADELPPDGTRAAFYLWNLTALLLSAALTGVLSLLFAVGVFYYEIFFSYFSHPLILLLNYLPIVIVQAFLLCLLNRQWLAYLVTALIFLSASIGHFFKLKFRNEAFIFADIRSIGAGLRVARNYGLSLTARMVLALACVLVTALLLLLFARGRFHVRGRLVLAALLLFSIFPLWRFVYSSSEIYTEKTENNDFINPDLLEQFIVSKGFIYPFLHSITEVLPPENYNAAEAAAILNKYDVYGIPDDRRVNIVALQLESFCDLGVMGFSGIDESAYAPLHRLQEEALSGTMIAHVTGGGTCTSEYCFLTGTYGGLFYHYDTPTYVRFFNDQGYMTTGGHPNNGDFYNRVWVSQYFGFQEYLTLENYYQELTNGRWQCDDVLLPDIFSHYKELAEAGQSVFSFTVTLQGHGAYRADEYQYDTLYWPGEGCSESSRCVLNNYLGSVAQTQELLWEQLELLRDDPTPVVVLLYGDHTPFLTSQQVYDEAGVSFDLSTEDGMMHCYGTPYVIWANGAAKAVTGRAFSGDGPTISPGYLMNILFDAIGWRGDAFMQYTNSVMQTLPVASTRGLYVEDGVYTRELSPSGAELLHEYRCVQHYYHDLLLKQR